MDSSLILPSRLTKKDRVVLNKQRADQIRLGFSDLSQQRKIFIDCSFGAVMNATERSSLTLQIQECYSHLRSHGNGRTQMFVTSIDGDVKAALDKQGGQKWAIHRCVDSVEEVLKSLDCYRNTIFLSPDATEELTFDELQGINGFILGGIVDRRVSRNESAHKAIRMDIMCRRLPIDFLTCRNKVFNIDTVFLFLLKAFCCSSRIHTRQEMVELLQATLPDRKILPDNSSSPNENQLSDAPRRFTEFEQQQVGNQCKLKSYSVVDLFQS